MKSSNEAKILQKHSWYMCFKSKRIWKKSLMTIMNLTSVYIIAVYNMWKKNQGYYDMTDQFCL